MRGWRCAPCIRRQPVDGFTNEVRLDELDPESASQVRDVLNAGATIGAVRETDTHGHYLVRSELYTFLSDVIKRELKTASPRKRTRAWTSTGSRSASAKR